MNLPFCRRLGRISSALIVLGALAPAIFAMDVSPAAKVGVTDPMLVRVFPSIVRIEAIRLRPADGRLTKQWTGGSGVIISAQGHVVTNCHVTEDGDFFRCYLYDGTHIEATLVGQDALTDIAILQLDMTQRPKNAAPLVVTKFGDSDRLAAGNEVFALGSPGFLAQSVTRGVVSNPSLVLPEQTAGKMILRGEDVGTLVRWVLHDARIFGGNSGGPLVNTQGEIVGINEIGVFNLSGAIPSNLAHVVAEQLIAHRTVTRGWSGVTVQPRLEADGAGPGVVIGDIMAGSPATRAGLLPGDLIVACDGHPIEGEEEKAVAHFNRLEASQLPDHDFAVDYVRAGTKHTAQIKLVRREAAQADDAEVRGWGAVVRDLTQKLAREERLPDERGIWLESVRPAGPCGQAEPILRRGDVLIAVDGTDVTSVNDLKALTTKLLADASNKTRTVLASVRREGAVLTSIVELRETPEHNVTHQARKGWLGVASQPLTPKLSNWLGIKAEGGVRLTRIYPETQAASAGLQVGDVVLALDGVPVTARRPEDTDVFARQIRQYKAGTQAALSVWRKGEKKEVSVTIQEMPTPAAELAWWEDTQLEFSARDIAFDDRVRLQLEPGARGAIVDTVMAAGWAALAGLRGDDLITKADGAPIATVAELERARKAAAAAGHDWWVLLVERRGETHFIEIKLKSAKS